MKKLEIVKDSTFANPFAEKLYNAKIPGRDKKLDVFKNRRELNKFRNNIYNSSPSFSMLWQMANFIKIAEMIYFYPNTVKNNIYSSKSYSDGSNGFKITRDDCTIILKLVQEDSSTRISITRNTTDKMCTEFKFVQEDWTEPHTYIDDMLLDNVIRIINTEIISVFDFCYTSLTKQLDTEL